jgi:hypothetical protein
MRLERLALRGEGLGSTSGGGPSSGSVVTLNPIFGVNVGSDLQIGAAPDVDPNRAPQKRHELGALK